MKYLIILLMLFSCGARNIAPVIVERTGPTEFKIIQGLCTGETINVDLDEREQTATAYIRCRPFNMTTGEYLGESEPLDMEDGRIMMMMTLEEFDAMIDHYELENIGDQGMLYIPMEAFDESFM